MDEGQLVDPQIAGTNVDQAERPGFPYEHQVMRRNPGSADAPVALLGTAHAKERPGIVISQDEASMLAFASN